MWLFQTVWWIPRLLQHMQSPAWRWFLSGKGGIMMLHTQEEINQLIVESAAAHKKVLRLKVEILLFSAMCWMSYKPWKNILFPLKLFRVLQLHQGASAYAGIPLTARGCCTRVQFLTFNPNSVYTEEQWKWLASTPDTLFVTWLQKSAIIDWYVA